MSAFLKRLLVLLICAVPLTVFAENDGDTTAAAQDFLATADEYRQHAANVRAKMSSFSPQARSFAQRLIGVYGQLAQIKEQMADAITAHNWDKRLETQYYRLKDQEKRLWSSIEAAN